MTIASSSTIDVAASVTTLMTQVDLPTQLNAAQQRIAALEQDLKQITWKLDQAERFERQKTNVVRRIYQDASGDELPYGYDVSAMYDRLVGFVESDLDAEVWKVEREYDVTVTYVVTLSGTVTAASKEAARELIESDMPALAVDEEGALQDYTFDSTVEFLSVSE